MKVTISLCVAILLLVSFFAYKNEVARKEKVVELTQTLERFRSIPGYDPSSSDYIISELESAIDSKVTTWEELGTDPDELKNLERLNRVKEARLTLERFRSIPGYDPSSSDYIISELESAIDSKVTTWEELGTDKAELEKLARKNKAKSQLLDNLLRI